MKTARRHRGFTLMEVLAAAVLVAIVMPAAMHGISVAASLANVARHRTEAAALAQSKLGELQATRGWQTGNLSGDFGPEHPEFRWSADLVAWEPGTLQQLDVTVLWNSRGREQRVTLSTLVDAEAN
ncbi:MAG: prepilin-type N-terminal cleavage/methylation domain-containing protein [Planctomycetota bacterium]|nr:prepilin-type N-terminal cleavage/methylation domain-containing protein [Planctomycetota bacterium]